MGVLFWVFLGVFGCPFLGVFGCPFLGVLFWVFLGESYRQQIIRSLPGGLLLFEKFKVE